MKRTHFVGSPIALLAVGSASGCSHVSNGSISAPPVRPTAAVTTNGPSPTSTSSATSAFARACTQAMILPLVKSTLDSATNRVDIERVDIQRCQNGYAFVIAVPHPTPGLESGERVFLHFADGSWRWVASGSGLSCKDIDLRPDVLAACRALDFPR